MLYHQQQAHLSAADSTLQIYEKYSIHNWQSNFGRSHNEQANSQDWQNLSNIADA